MRRGILLILLLTVSIPADAKTLPAAGDGRHAWAALPGTDESTIALWHHGPGDALHVMRRVERLRGSLAANHAVAAADGSLWLVYRDGSVQQVQAHLADAGDAWVFQSAGRRRLPQGATLRSLAADAGGVWALVTISSADVLRAVDQPPPAAAPTPNSSRLQTDIVLGLPLKKAPAPAEPQDADDEEEQAGESAEPIDPQDRLLQLAGGGWRKVGLPDDWSRGARSALVSVPGGHGRPMLLAQTGGGQPPTSLRVYEPVSDDDSSWRRTDYQLNAATPWAATVVEGQFVLAQATDQASVALSVLRAGRLHPMGQVSLPAPDAGWALLPVGDTAAVMAEQPDDSGGPGLGWTLLDLRGRVIGEATPMTVDPRAARVRQMQRVMFVAVIVLSLLMLFVFWQRDPRLYRPQLDQKTRIGRVWRRLIAGAIDLAVAAAPVMVYHDLRPVELYEHWGMLQMDPIEALPALVVIGLFVAHTAAGELIWSRSLGKKFAGLRVSKLDGGRPGAGQVVVRNVLKLFDLVAPLLLVLPLLSPHRQRLGDLVARTLVVEPVDPSGQEGE